MSIISKQRELLFDNLRGVLIFLVILGHALEYFRLNNQTGTKGAQKRGQNFFDSLSYFELYFKYHLVING